MKIATLIINDILNVMIHKIKPLEYSFKSHMFNDLCWNLTYYSRLAVFIYEKLKSCTSSICLVYM